MVRRALNSGNRSVGRKPLQEQRGYERARMAPMSPPVGGWNARDALGAMPATDAVRLRNWFPQQSDCVMRPGYEATADTGTGEEVSQLIPFEYATNFKLLACSDGGVYVFTVNASTGAISGSVSTLETGLSGNDWSYDYLGGYVLMANGADAPRAYEGTTFSTPSWAGSGLTNSTLNHVHVYKSRAYFVQANTQAMWYGGVAAVTGTLTKFDFATVAPIRGNLLFTTHGKGDGGDGGQDDLFVAVFDSGDVLTYTGSDPGSDFSLVGHYKIGEPLSRLSYSNESDDVYIITRRGYEKLSIVLQWGDSAPDRVLLSDKIQGAVSIRMRYVTPQNSIKWRCLTYQKGQMLIVSLPQYQVATNLSYDVQHVQNINTEAWCDFSGIAATSWAILGSFCFFGHSSDGVVYLFDGPGAYDYPFGKSSDNGAEIECDCHMAWSSLGAGTAVKQVALLRPHIIATTKPAISIDVYSDFDGPAETDTYSFEAAEDPVDYSGIYPVFPDYYPYSPWFSRNAVGANILVRFTIKFGDETAPRTLGRVTWNRMEVIYTASGAKHARGVVGVP